MTTGILPAANQWFQSKPMGPYAGQTVAGFTPNQTRSWDAGAGAAVDRVNLAQAGLDEWSQSMDYGRAGNPWLDEQIGNMQDQAWQGFRRNTSPGITNDAISAGQMGGTRQGIAQGIAMGDLNRATTDAAAGMRSNAYGQQLNFQNQMLNTGQGLMQNYNQSRMAPYQMMQGTGLQQQGMNQARMDAAQGQWNEYDQYTPNRINQYNAMVNPAAYGTQSGQYYGTPSMGASALGGAMAGYGIANQYQSPQQQPNVNQYAPNVNAYNSGGGYGSRPNLGL